MNPPGAIERRFEAWLTRETGIDATSLGINALERAVLERVQAAQMSGALAANQSSTDAIDAYWQWLNGSRDERQALLEELVVPETWFFRDREAFVALTRMANDRLVREPGRVLGVLSVPCSTGEEPYSIAMALLDAGIGAERFTVDAIDISARAIEAASKAVYGRNSFRGYGLEFRERHFDDTAGGSLLHARIRQAVRFTRANLFELPQELDMHYDFIFCRNVLIYFDRDAQDRTIRLLDARLADGGTIFVGPAESGLMMRHTMTSARIPLAFAFQRTRPDAAAWQTESNAATRPAHGGQAAKTPPWVATPRPAAATAKAIAPARPAALKPVVAPPAPERAKPSLTLADVRRLADAGRLDEAERLVHEFVIEHGPHADAFCLLGLIADARGRRADAADFYRKALYLAPAHYEALTHHAALLGEAGDSDGARRLLRRAERAADRAPAEPVDHLRGFHGSRGR